MKKPKEHISMDLEYGTKCLLHVTNIVLFGIVIILAIISICIYFLMPVADVSKLAKKTDVQGVVENIPDSESAETGTNIKDELEDNFYNIIATRNVFSPQRKDWVVKAAIPKASGKIQTKTAQRRKKAFAGKPKKFVLHGILIAGDIKKALINNPFKGVRKEKTLYVHEGEDLDGYKVKSIEKDRIKLDWYGEEIVVTLYSGTNNNDQSQNQENEVKKPIKSIKRLKVNKNDISIKKKQDIEKSLVASVVDVKGSESDGSTYVKNVFDDILFNPLTMVSESLFMPAMKDTKITGLDDIKKDEEKLHDLKDDEIDRSNEEHEITKVAISKPSDMALKEELNEKSITRGPAIINSHSIFLVDDIRKAMIDNQHNTADKKQDLYVEERDDHDWQDEQIISSVFDEALFNPMSMTYKSIFVTVMNNIKVSGLDETQEVTDTLHDLEVDDIGPSDEEHEITKVAISEPSDIALKEKLNKKSISKKQAIINLKGIIIVDGIRKALIDNLSKGIDKKQTLYVQEGDDLDGFRVTSIEKDMIRLDWQGEERIATLNSAYYKQEVCATERINETMDKMEVDEEYKLEKNIKEVDDSHVVAAVGDEIVEENERVISNVFDEPFNPMSMAHESLFMPVLNDIKASGSDEIQEAADTLPDIEVDNIVHSDKVLQVAMVEPADSIYMVLDEERLKQKALSEVPTQIILKGIVIAGNIRKAMVNVPMSKISKNRTLYVEEGDGLEGYLVTRIESMQIRLDWHGKETIVAFQGSY